MADVEKVRTAFDMFDTDNSGTVNGMELIKVLRGCPGVEDDAAAADLSVVSSKGEQNRLLDRNFKILNCYIRDLIACTRAEEICKTITSRVEIRNFN